MILSKSDLQRYLELDRRALGIRRAKRPPLTGYRVWKFQVALRKHEYYANTGRSLFGRIMKKFWGAVHEIYGVRLGFSIPINVFGPGLRINHYGLIVVNPKARVGAFCDIHQGVNIGEGFGKDDVPEIGDHVYIGPGAKIYGRIRIGRPDRRRRQCRREQVVRRPDTTIAGVPARQVADRGNPYEH